MLRRNLISALSSAILVFAFFGVGLISCHPCAATEDRAEYLLVYDGADKVAPRIVDVDCVLPGEAKAVSIRFRNESKGDVRFVNAHLGCKCLDAQITKESVPRGTETIMEFHFDGDKAPRSSVRLVQTQVELEDRTFLTIQFKLHYQKLAGFTREDFTHTTFREDHSKDVETQFSVPLAISADVSVKDLKPIATENLKFVSFDIREVDAKPFLIGKYSTVSVDEMTEVGEVKLIAEGLPVVQSLRLALAVDGRYRLFPEVLTLQENESKESFTGTLMLRVQGLKSQDAVESVEFGSEFDVESKVELAPINTGVYRLKFRFPSQALPSESVPIRIKHAGIRTDFSLKYRCSK